MEENFAYTIDLENPVRMGIQEIREKLKKDKRMVYLYSFDFVGISVFSALSSIFDISDVLTYTTGGVASFMLCGLAYYIHNTIKTVKEIRGLERKLISNESFLK